MAIYPYSFTMPPVNKQDIPSDGVVGEFLGISAGGVLDWLPVAGGGGGGDMLKADNLSGLADYAIARTNIGLGLTSSPEFANLTLTSPSLSSSAPVTISQTWNNAAVPFSALVVNAAGPSLSNSLLLDLQFGGVSKFKVEKSTSFVFRNNTILFEAFGANTSGLQCVAQENFTFRRGESGTNRVLFNNLGVYVTNSSAFGFSSTGDATGAADTILVRDSASGNTLALRNGAAAQTFNVYGTSSASNANYARLALTCGLDGNATISTQALGTGTAGTVSINGVPVGLGAGNIVSNVVIGTSASLAANNNIVAIGYFSSSNVSGIGDSVSIGAYSAQGANSGNNVSIGAYSHQQGGAFQSVAVGAFASQKLGGSNNSIVGAYAMQGTQAGSNNNAFGRFAGRYITDGTTLNTSCDNSIFIGANTRPLANSQTNQIVIGDSAIGIGSNSVVLGNDSITKTALKGNVGIGTTAPGAPLHVQAAAILGARETLLKATVSDNATDGFYIYNATTLDNIFVPTFSGSTFNSTAFTSIQFQGITNAANDIGTNPLIFFQSGTVPTAGDPTNQAVSAVTTRPSFAFRNGGTIQMQMAANGNLGIGTTAPTSRLHVQATGQTGVRENLLKCTVSDSGNDAFYMANATVADGSFVPGFIGAVFSSSARYCLNLAGQTIAANDTGTAPMVAFSTAITTDATDPNNGTLSAVGTRPLFTWVNFTTTHMQMAANGNLGIGTTSPTSKLHVEGGTSPTITLKNTAATGYGQLLFQNTVVSGTGFWLNGSTQTGYGGANSLNAYSSDGPLAFHTASVTNALSIAQNGAATFSSTVVASSFYPAGILGLSHNGLAVTLGTNTWKLQVEGTLLCFSGVTASFPAFKRVGSEFQVVNAGTTAALNVAAPEADLTFIEDRYRRKGAGTPEGVVTAPIGAVYHNTTGGAGTSFYVKESGTGNTGWVGK